MSRRPRVPNKDRLVYDSLLHDGPVSGGISELADRLDLNYREAWQGLRGAKGIVDGGRTVAIQSHGRNGGATIKLVEATDSTVEGGDYLDRVGREQRTRLETQGRTAAQLVAAVDRGGYGAAAVTAFQSTATFIAAAAAAQQAGLDHLTAAQAQAGVRPRRERVRR